MKVKHNMEHNKNYSKRQVHITKLFQKSGGWWEISYNELKIIPKNIKNKQEKYQNKYLMK